MVRYMGVFIMDKTLSNNVRSNKLLNSSSTRQSLDLMPGVFNRENTVILFAEEFNNHIKNINSFVVFCNHAESAKT